jgi:hypothetical protein
MELQKKCCLCDKTLKYNATNKHAVKQGLPTTDNTHDPDAKSEAHIGHVSGGRSRQIFRNVSTTAWQKMGIDSPMDTLILCYECHEEILHNPVLSKELMGKLANIFKGKSFEAKVVALNEIIAAGIEAIQQKQYSRSLRSG